MNKRFSKQVRLYLKASCVLSICLGAAGCSDDYKWDDNEPDFLNSSIYETLKQKGNYTTFIKIIDELDYAEVLSKTGSKTLFIADDDAFNTFYQNNEWGVKSYSQLTKAQKRLLLNSAMINNAYLIEMMSNTEGPVEGECLRRSTSIAVTDSVPHFTAESLPVSYNTTDIDYWARFRESSKNGITLALDNSPAMMTHFLETQMSFNNITDEDFKIIVGEERQRNDAYVYDCKVTEQDITCQNGYINKLSKVLIPRQNMAEVLRTNGATNIFSHMVERFSAPYYSESLTNSYRLIYGNDVDSVFEKSYFNSSALAKHASIEGTAVHPLDPNGNRVDYALLFDPGWNEYRTDAKTAKEEDMGVIFAPSDQKLYEYFFDADGGGRFLLEAYAPTLISSVTSSADYTNIYKCIDQIPLDVIQALINNLMKESFVNSVPSKFETIKDDAQDPMLDADDIKYIDKVLLANNGIIYVMNEVLTPAKYAAVSAPAYVATDMKIFNWAVNQATLDVQTNFYAYLLAMSSRFSFFVPTDNDFWYVDPVSFAYNFGDQRIYHYEWDEKNSKPTVTAFQYRYDFSTGKGEVGTQLSTTSISENEWKNRLRDMLESHTLVHEDNSSVTGINETATGIECDQHYFIAKNGAPIYVENASKRDKGCTVEGGFQYANDTKSNVIRFDDKTKETNGNGNGFAYELDSPLIPSIESVFSVMYNNKNSFGDFFELCQTDDEVLEALGIKSNVDKRKYQIFINNKGLPCFDKTTNTKVTDATNVKTFNNYRYTVYVPTNDAVRSAIEKGLPTWETIRHELELDKEAEERTELTEKEEEARRVKCLAMVSSLVNFIKYHFQDNSVFADTPALQPTNYETATLDVSTGIYCKVKASSSGNNTLNITDATGKSVSITSNKNILTRDYVLNASGTSAKTISASSFAVMHGINGVLNYKTYTNGRYDSDWTTESAAKRYLSKFSIKE